jgi:hypothetical protein
VRQKSGKNFVSRKCVSDKFSSVKERFIAKATSSLDAPHGRREVEAS